MTDPVVSVVVPAYNRADTLPRALGSALGQSFGDFEIIVVDDGSRDGTVEVAEGIGDPRLRCVRHEGNRGEAAARNSGVRAARAPLLAWLDSDDEWLPGKLEAQVALMREDESVTASCTGYYLKDISSKDEWEMHNTIPATRLSWLEELYLGCGISLGTTLMVRKDVQEKIGPFDETLVRHTDWDWLVRYARRHLISSVDRTLARVHYRTTHVASGDVERSARQFVGKHGNDIKALGFVKGRKIVGKRWLETSRFLFKDRKFGKGTSYLLQALATWPFQNPGLYAQIVDAVFGTGLASRVTALRRGLGERAGSPRR